MFFLSFWSTRILTNEFNYLILSFTYLPSTPPFTLSYIIYVTRHDPHLTRNNNNNFLFESCYYYDYFLSYVIVSALALALHSHLKKNMYKSYINLFLFLIKKRERKRERWFQIILYRVTIGYKFNFFDFFIFKY
jgi:hypothetical protein